jgi:N-methylhydantoinase A/oxoprolinase/acetone carboxylase beta subunit
VDVGGTFTDCAAVGADGRVVTRKVLSTPQDQSEGVVDALLALEAPPGAVTRVVHGTTVVTNLLLERTGARVVLCATAGVTDLLELRRQDRVSLYDLSAQHPAPLVTQDDVIAVAERITPHGVERALEPAETARVVAEVRARKPEAVVVALLHAYADDAHERALAVALRDACPDIPVLTSTEVLPEIREYERVATAVADGYARPRVAAYLERLTARLASHRFPAPAVMTSGGGMRGADSAARHAASLALSGPAGGVVGAAAVLHTTGRTDALTIDIGGTSADAGLIWRGEPLVEPGGEVAGVPIALPRVLVETVSAGGGSIAWVDDGGALRVGPRSAGAVPGPVAFGRGGTEPTVTDAQLALGRIDAARMSGGVALDADAARAAIAALAAKLGADARSTAEAILRAADAEMARALRRVSVERGVDPRDCTLVAFGGGGPLHACALADALAMTDVLIPPFAGVLSAVGLALAPERHERATSVLVRAEELSADALRAQCDALADALTGSERRWIARVRYVGQGHELDVDCQPGGSGNDIAARFTEIHRARYGFTLPHAVEIVALRHTAGEPGTEATFTRDPQLPPWDAERRIDTGGAADQAVVRGPASIALSDATLWVADLWYATARPEGGWHLTREARP